MLIHGEMTITRTGHIPGHPEAEPEYEDFDLIVEIVGDRQPRDPESGLFEPYIDDLRAYQVAPTGHRVEVDLDESEVERAQEILLDNYVEAKALRGRDGCGDEPGEAVSKAGRSAIERSVVANKAAASRRR